MKVTDQPEMTLALLGGGAMEEKFRAELDKVMKNINDPNSADGKREINIKIAFNHNAKRSACEILISTSCKLQPDTPFESQAYIGKVGARDTMWEHNPDQMRLSMEDGAISEVSTLSVGGIEK